MRKRMLSILLSLCMLFSLAPASVFAQDELEETDECICETQCSEESINNDCPVCSKEGATLEDCRMYVPVIEESNETIINQVNENNNGDSINNEVLENESNEESNTTVVIENEENNVSIITSKDVQDLIDALPDTTTINEDNAEGIEAQLEAIDNLKAELSDEELDSIDFTRYVEVATVLEQILYGVQESSNQIMPASYSGRSIRLGTSGISSPTEVIDQNDSNKKSYSPNSYIYFGVNSLDNNKPIKWRVLDADKANDGTTNGMFLLSEYLLDSFIPFNSDKNKGNVYQGSDAQNWCTTFADNTNNFSDLEKSAMLGVTKNDDDSGRFFNYYSFGRSYLNINDKMFFLSAKELASYVGNYDRAPEIIAMDTAQKNGGWWLRSPGNHIDGITHNNKNAGTIWKDGFVTVNTVDVMSIFRPRPAFNLDSNNILFTSSAVNGKYDDISNASFTPVGTTNSAEWKLTLKDSSRSNFDASTNINFARPGEYITISYSGSKTGHKEYVSAMIVDENDDVLYYKLIYRPLDGESSGAIDVPIPADIAPGNYTLKVFNEQCNEDYKTDYASDFVDIPLTIREEFSEQFNLAKGERYYFDLSGLSIPGTVNPYLPDTTLHYVPFVYTGTVDAYVLNSVSNHVGDSSMQASKTSDPNARYGYTYYHSLFMADDQITGSVSWVGLNDKGFIFGKSYTANGVDYTLRAPTVGGTFNASNPKMPYPNNNEWNQIIDKERTYFKFNPFLGLVQISWGQDTNSYLSQKLKNGRYIKSESLFSEEENYSDNTTYYRPVLEVLNPKTLGSDGLKAITLNLGGGKLGGSGDDIKIVVRNNGTYTAPSYEGLTRPDGNNDTYFYWLDSDGNSYLPGDAVSSGVITLTAKWEPLKYSVTLDVNGGVINNSITEYVYGEGVVLPSASDMTKEGYTFGGWYTSSDFSGSFVTNIGSTERGNKTYYAKWNVNQYTISFDTSGGSTIEAITLDYGSSITKPSNPTRSGYSFIGWDISIPNTMPAYDMTIKAKWLDSEKPSGEIKIATNSWKTLLNSISFGLFFKDSQTVSINAYDNSNEEVKIEYLLSNSLLSITELDNQSFNLYTRPFNINPNNEYVIYAKLTDTSNNVSYISSDGLVLDDISPVVTGIESGKTYCEKKTVTVNDKYINSVKVNGNEVTLDSNNSFILGYGKQNIIVTDKSGNKSEVNVTINNGHSFGGYNFDGVDTHTRKCNICGSSETYKCIDENKDHKCDVCNGLISKCVDLNKNHKCDICGKTISSHKGGETTCTNKSICEICGQEYGELGKHLNLKHIEETKATTTSTGNKEYWYCEECNRYYSDKDGLNEISKKDTVIERLKDDNTNKDDNAVEIEHKDINPIIWAVVPVVGVAIISGIILVIKRKR